MVSIATAEPRQRGARIDVEQVSHWFAQRAVAGAKAGQALQVIDGLDLSIAPGEFVALLGPSGCGKSTLLRLVAGLEPASRGPLRQDGAPTAEPDPPRIVVFQDPTLSPWRTAWDTVALGVALAGALVTDPRLLVLDEPLGKLDSLTRLAMQTELVQLWQRAGFSALLVTHDVEEALFMAQRVVVFTERPARVREVLVNDLPYPRHRGDARLAELRRRALALLGLGDSW